MSARFMPTRRGRCHCGALRFAIDFLGVNVFCLDDFDRSGIPVRVAAGAAMD